MGRPALRTAGRGPGAEERRGAGSSVRPSPRCPGWRVVAGRGTQAAGRLSSSTQGLPSPPQKGPLSPPPSRALSLLQPGSPAARHCDPDSDTVSGNLGPEIAANGAITQGSVNALTRPRGVPGPTFPPGSGGARGPLGKVCLEEAQGPGSRDGAAPPASSMLCDPGRSLSLSGPRSLQPTRAEPAPAPPPEPEPLQGRPLAEGMTLAGPSLPASSLADNVRITQRRL